MRHTPALLLSMSLLALGAACGSRTALEGGGLVLLPDEDPLPHGVATRDSRPNYHDFGRVPDGEVAKHVFRLRNADPQPISITRVIPGCGCTVASLRTVKGDGTVVQGEPISSKALKLLVVAPGDLAEIEVQMATRDLQTKNADKLVTMAVTTDSPNGYYLNLEVHIWVDKPFTVVPGAIALGLVPVNGGAEGQVEIVRAGPTQHELKALLPLPAGVHANLLQEIRNGIAVWTLHAGLDAPLTLGPRMVTLEIATEESQGKPGRVLAVPLTAQVVPDLVSEPARLVFSAARDEARTSSAELRSLLAGQRLRVTSVELPEEQRALFELHVEPLEPDADGAAQRWKITLSTRPPLPATEIQRGTILVHLDDPQHPRFELEYVVHVK